MSFSSFPLTRRLLVGLGSLFGALVVLFAFAHSVDARTSYAGGATIPLRLGVWARHELDVAPSSAATPLTWSWRPTSDAGVVPPGLSLDVDGSRLSRSALISGAPTTVGTYQVKVRAIGPSAEAYEGAYTYNVIAPSLVMLPATIPSATVGTPFSMQASLETGSGIRLGASLWQEDVMSTLPPGLSFDAGTGVLSGTPTVAGTYVFTLMGQTSTDVASYAYREYTMRIFPAISLRFTEASPVNATVGSAYRYQFLAGGGTAPRTMHATNVSQLPPGLTLASDGTLSGTPTAAGTYAFTVKVDDAAGGSASQAVTMTFAAAASPLAITPGLPFLPGTVRVAYPPQMPRATGGRAPYTWSVASGELPPGLLVDGGEGIVSGMPTVAGTYTFQVRVDDAAGASAFATYTIVINAATVTTPSIPSLPTAPTSPTSPTAPTSPIVTPPIVGSVTFPTTPALTARLDVLSRLGIGVHALVKLPDDGNRATQADSAVYYIGADGRRHAFSNDKVYFTWYTNFAGVRVVSASALAEIPLGANVTYKPGVKLVKFQTDPKVYAVAGRQLRPIASEAVALALYGSAWNRQIDDISDAFYTDYQFGSEIRAAADYSVSGSREAMTYPSDALPS